MTNDKFRIHLISGNGIRHNQQGADGPKDRTRLLKYAILYAAKQWWIETFGCKAAKVPTDWDNTLPSDVVLKFPGDDELTILLSAQREVDEAKFDRPSPVVSTIFCDKLRKGHQLRSSRGILVGPIQDGGDMQFFEIRDTEGHLIQVCKES
jgi:hypothetical protein